MSDFKVGDKVLITKPKVVDGTGAYWHKGMDKYDGLWFEIKSVGMLIRMKDLGWSFDRDWLTPEVNLKPKTPADFGAVPDTWPPKIEHTVDFEKDFSVGDLVLVTKPKDETALWSREMDMFDGLKLDIRRSNGLHFWILEGAGSNQFHESWLTPVAADQNEDMIQADNLPASETIAILQGQLAESQALVAEYRQYDHVDFLKMTPMTKMYRK